MSNQIEDALKFAQSQGIFFIVILGICIFISYEIYLAATNTSSFDQNWKYYFITIVVPLVVLFAYILYGYTLQKQEIVLLYIIFGLVIVLLGILYILIYTGLSQLLFNQYILYTLSFGIIVIGLAIVYNVFTEKFKKQTGWSGFLVNILFYIPCLISDFIQYIISEYSQTPRTTFILFVIEILLILFYFYLLPAMNTLINRDSLLLVDKPIMLSAISIVDKELRNQNFDKHDPPINSSNLIGEILKETHIINEQFALSMWIYINPMSPSKMGYRHGVETNIFNYGSVSSSPVHHPQITHTVGDQGTNIRIRFTNDDKSIYDMMMPYQKWVNLVFNYNGNGVDLFIDGKLEYSYLFSNDKPDFTTNDIMTVGQDNGLVNNDSIYGSICNIVYYKNPMTNINIINNYNMLMYKNPPTR